MDTFQTEPSHEHRPVIDPLAAEAAEMRESLELARSDIRRTKSEIARYQDEHQSHVRHTRVLWGIVVLLVVTLAGLLWYTSPVMREHRGMVGNLPVLQSTLDSFGTRVAATEEKIGAWANDRIGFTDRMAKLENIVGSNLRTVRNEAKLMAQQIKSETGERIQAVQNRLSGVESIQREHGEVVAQLQGELQGVRKELAGLREENGRQIQQAQQQYEEMQQSTHRALSGLDQRLTSNQTAVSALGYQVDRKRIDFELQNGRTQQVTDGIYVTVRQTNVAQQRVDGWVQIARDGRIVWLRGEGAQQPVEFASKADSRSYRVVFTRVGKNDAAGYILVPNTSETPSEALSAR